MNRRVSVVVPARNEARRIGNVVQAVLAQQVACEIEVIVVDDGSSDGTADAARKAGAHVVQRLGSSGNPGAARNHGARAASGDPIAFLDADCTPSGGWLAALLRAHDSGVKVAGGAMARPPAARLSARCNHYCAWYHTHPRRRRGIVPNHPPANISVRRDVFFATPGFTESMPVADGHEELVWQDTLRREGTGILFEPDAIVVHDDRPGWRELLRRNYRWAYSSIQAKTASRAVRAPWLYQRPWLLVLAAPAVAIAHTVYTAACWARAGVIEPLVLLPALFLGRVAYASGMAAGGIAWLTGRQPARPATFAR